MPYVITNLPSDIFQLTQVLRAAGLSLETRKVILGNTDGDITTHYSAPEIQELIDAVDMIAGEKSVNDFTSISVVKGKLLIRLVAMGGLEPPTSAL